MARSTVVTFHGLRHSFATLSLQAGAGLPDTSRVLGHASPETTMKICYQARGAELRVPVVAVDALTQGDAANLQRNLQRRNGKVTQVVGATGFEPATTRPPV